MRAVSSVYGRIETLLLVLPVTLTSGYRPEELLEALYAPLLGDLPDDREYIVLALYSAGVSGHCRVLSGENLEGRLRWDTRIGLRNTTLMCIDLDAFPSFRPFASRQRMSRWAQDAFIALENDVGATVLLKPVESMLDAGDNRADFFTADFLALSAGMLLRPFACRVQGGDILVGDNYALVGRRTLTSNARSAHVFSTEEEQRITGEFRKALGVQHIIPIGGGPGGGEGLYHIDYYLTPGGKNERGEELLFVGRIQEGCLLTTEDEVISRRAERAAAQYNIYLDSVAEQIEAHSADPHSSVRFEVVRLPLILDYFRRGELVVRPYNNCLVEVYGSTKNAYLPSYTEYDHTGANIFGDVERRAREVFERCGFSVAMVRDNFCNTTRLGGSLRCMVKELRRSRPAECELMSAS